MATTVKFIFFSSVFQLSCNDLRLLCCMTDFVLKTTRTDGHSGFIFFLNFCNVQDFVRGIKMMIIIIIIQ